MADLTQDSEFQKFIQQYSGVQKAQPTTPQFVPQVPQATQGPLMANDPRAVPMMGEWEVQGAKPGQFPLGIPEDKLIPQPVTNTPQVEPQVPQVDRGEFRPTGGAGFIPASQVPIPADREAGFIPTVETAKAQFGTPEFVQPAPQAEAAAVAPQFGLADPTSSTAPTGEDPFSGPIVQPQVPQADPNQQIRLADPTSSTVGLNPTQVMLQERFGAPTVSGIMAADEGLGMRTDPQGRMIDPNVDRSFFEQQSAERNERALAEFGQARGPDSTDRGAGEMTTADAKDLAALRDPNASASEKARGRVVAERNGLDPLTGAEKTSTTGGMTAYQAATLAQKDRDFNYDVLKEQQGEVAAKAESQKRASLAASDAMRQNQNIMDTAREAGKNIGITTTGAGGALLGIIPGTGAFDQKSTVDTLQADAAFTALQNMRDSSPTGGALGQVSERELKLLSSNVRNLDHKQSPEQFRKNLAEYVKLRNQSMANMYRAYETDFSTEEANAAFGVSGIDDFSGKSSGGIKNDRNVASTADSLLEKY